MKEMLAINYIIMNNNINNFVASALSHNAMCLNRGIFFFSSSVSLSPSLPPSLSLYSSISVIIYLSTRLLLSLSHVSLISRVSLSLPPSLLSLSLSIPLSLPHHLSFSFSRLNHMSSGLR